MKTSLDHSFSDHLRIIRGIYHWSFGSQWLEKCIEIMLCSLKIITPGFWIRVLVRNYHMRNLVIEWYIVLKVLLLGCIVYYYVGTTWWMWITLYFLIDIVQVMLSFVFLNNVYVTAPSLRKNFAHLGINLIEIVLSFSILYLHFQAIGSSWEPITRVVDAIYFSMVTFATVWYGDITPFTMIGKILVMSQIIISFLFITIICSSFVSDFKLKEH